MFPSVRYRLARVGPWPRRAAALLCLVLAFGAFLTDRPARPHAAARTQSVVVAARSMPVGHRLTAHDLTRRSWPTRLSPDGALTRPESLLGKVLASPVARGEPMSAGRVVGRDLTAGLGTDQVAAVVGVDDANAAALIRAGDRVDVLASPARTVPADSPPPSSSSSHDPVLLIKNARVLAVLPGGDRLPERSDVVVATTRAAATRLIRASSSQMFTVLPRSP